MSEIIVSTQAELDALPASFDEWTHIVIRSTNELIIVRHARENSRVEACGNSRVEACGNSRVVAKENSSVVANENSSVEAWENSRVVARENVGVRLYSSSASVLLYGFAVCWILAEGKVIKKANTATVIRPTYRPGTDGWLEQNGIEDANTVTLYKRVSADFRTQEGTDRETKWAVGSTVEHSNWRPDEDECGAGKFHACSRPYFCDEFRSGTGDRYIAIEIEKEDLYAWPNATYPHKIAFRKGRVLGEVNRFGEAIEVEIVG